MSRFLIVSLCVNLFFWWSVSNYHTVRINIESLTQKPTLLYKLRKSKVVKSKKTKQIKKKVKQKKADKKSKAQAKKIPKKIIKEPLDDIKPEEPVDIKEEPIIVDATELNEEIYPVHRVVPRYPSVAKKTGIEAQVYLEVIISPKGRVEHASVAYCSKPGYEFEKNAIEAVKKLRFEPIMQNGEAVRVKIIYPIDFVLVE
jgi:TonB family protein